MHSKQAMHQNIYIIEQKCTVFIINKNRNKNIIKLLYKVNNSANAMLRNYTVFQKTIHFYFYNNFFIREQIFIIFGKNVAKDIVNMQSLTCLLLTVQMSYS